jgi:ATP-dependent helicase Lhr and Lhr-like helicase
VISLALERRGVGFLNEFVSSTRRLPTEIEDALWELLARGSITTDAVQNIRVLMNQKMNQKMKRNRRALQRGGPRRWSLLLPHETVDAEAALEKLAMLYLNRYGIVFRDILAPETLAPPWRELAQIYARLEARGEIRGGRFVADLAGEQFALPDAIETSRSVRRQVTTGTIVYVAGVDPLNLTGIIGTGPLNQRKRGFVFGRAVFGQRPVIDLPASTSNRKSSALDSNCSRVSENGPDLPRHWC